MHYRIEIWAKENMTETPDYVDFSADFFRVKCLETKYEKAGFTAVIVEVYE